MDSLRDMEVRGLGSTGVRDTGLHLQAERSDAEGEDFGNLAEWAGCDAASLRGRGFGVEGTIGNVLWDYMCQDPRHEPEDWADFLHKKRDNEARHHRAGHDELTSAIYSNPAPVSPSGLTTTMPSQSYPQPLPHHWHQAYEAASPISQPPTFAFAAEYLGWFGPPR
ncbi:hypothetical protein EDD85DRAFT_796564 [Armillaria nabsnona]|nr:hypothetical protein EDD85DRAFT_796564 [Armillaria nabsnona]